MPRRRAIASGCVIVAGRALGSDWLVWHSEAELDITPGTRPVGITGPGDRIACGGGGRGGHRHQAYRAGVVVPFKGRSVLDELVWSR
ncbi:hypothetical protein [Nesterenkonia alba]|uniref:hypothetical protein n=1 Tax=Nesterenkonia alba TaxID=515814 RepID=UPI00146DE74D|nr:hypothetical protein [Nesterenkonia alba]